MLHHVPAKTCVASIKVNYSNCRWSSPKWMSIVVGNSILPKMELIFRFCGQLQTITPTNLASIIVYRLRVMKRVRGPIARPMAIILPTTLASILAGTRSMPRICFNWHCNKVIFSEGTLRCAKDVSITNPNHDNHCTGDHCGLTGCVTKPALLKVSRTKLLALIADCLSAAVARPSSK